MVQDTAATARRGDAHETANECAASGAASVVVSALSAWAPRVETAEEWREWAEGKRQIGVSTDAPSLREFTTSLFRRRLSQVSRMTIQVVHDTVEMAREIGGAGGTDVAGGGADWVESAPMVFVSNRGELSRELSVSRMLVSEHEVLPASFSLSVFNAPIALAAIALGLHGAYTAVYPVGGNFNWAFQAAAAQVLSGGCQRVIVVYADEAVPAEYAALPDAKSPDGKPLLPFAFACVVSASDGGDRRCSLAGEGLAVCPGEVPQSSEDFLRHLLLGGIGGGAAARTATVNGGSVQMPMVKDMNEVSA